jgi:C-terminal processing protease CtpA/Prc
MFQDVHQGGAAHKAGIRAGDLLLELNGKEVSPPAQPVFRMGCPMRLVIEQPSGDRTEVESGVPAPKSKKHPVNQPLAIECATLQPGLGLLKVPMFPGAIGIDLAHGFDRAVAALRECDRLIIVLRGNTGGGIGGLRLMSYLTPDKRPVGYSLTKKRAANGYRREDLSQFRRIPSHKATLLWHLLRYAFVDKSITVVTEGLGRQPFHGRVMILVNEHSASAAEMLAAFARDNNLSKIVGT